MTDAACDAAHADTIPPPPPYEEDGRGPLAATVNADEAARVVVDLTLQRDNATWLLRDALRELEVTKADLAAAKREIHDLNTHVDSLEEQNDEQARTIANLRKDLVEASDTHATTFDTARSLERSACMQDARDAARAYSAEGQEDAGFGALRVVEQIQKRANGDALVEFKL